jgi:hypothetical protein
MKNVLLISYHYPPSMEVGALRPSKFVKYLPEYGWEPIVLTLSAADAGEFVLDNRSAKIYRVREWPHLLKSYRCLKQYKLKRQAPEGKFPHKLRGPRAMAVNPLCTSIAGLKQWLLAFFLLPDRERGWLIPAVWRSMHLIREKHISHLITTGPPFACHLVGLLLKCMTEVHWVADFRDPWALSHKLPIHRNQITDIVEARLIRSVMERADLVLSVTPQMTDQARKEHPNLRPDKFVTLTNGFDPADFAGLVTPRSVSDRTTFLYPGSFYYGRTPEPFLRAMRSLIDDGIVRQCEVFIKLVGDTSIAESHIVPEIVQRLRLQDIVSVGALVSRREMLQQTLEAHVMLVLTEQTPHAYTFKLFDALATGAVVLNIGCGGAVAELLAKTGRGIAVDHTSVPEIRNGILECIRQSRDAGRQRNPEPWYAPTVQEFNFRYLTGKLTGYLEEL